MIGWSFALWFMSKKKVKGLKKKQEMDSTKSTLSLPPIVFAETRQEMDLNKTSKSKLPMQKLFVHGRCFCGK